MKKLITFLKQPYYVEYNPLKLASLFSLFVVFILLVFQPFGFSNATGIDFFLPLLLTVIATILGVFVVFYLIYPLFRNFFDPGNWTIGKDILNIFICIFVVAIINSVVHTAFSYLYYHNDSFERLLQIFGIIFMDVLLTSPLLIVMLTVLNRNMVLTSNLRQAQELNDQLLVRISKTIVDKREDITLTSNTKESVSMHSDELLFVESAGNYAIINYIKSGELAQKNIRTTIKQLEEQLRSHTFVIRCHRAFLVNINNISNVEGNSQGTRLAFTKTTQKIPVSRAYLKSLKEKLGTTR